MDYAALAAELGGTPAPAASKTPVDYAALAAEHGGTPAKPEPTKEAKAADEWENDSDLPDSSEKDSSLLKAAESKLKAVGIDSKTAQKKLKDIQKEGVGKSLLGGGDFALSQAAGLGMTVAGGLAGAGRTAYELAKGEGLDKATEEGAKVIQGVQGMAYEPRTAMGQALNEGASSGGTAVSKLAGDVVGGAVDLYNANPDKALYEKSAALPAKEAQDTKRISDKDKIALESLGEVAPAIYGTVKGGLSAQSKATAALDKVESSRGASMLAKAMKDFTPAELAEAEQLFKSAQELGTPITGPEAFPVGSKLHELLIKTDKANPVVSNFVKQRPEQARAAISSILKNIGEKVGLQNAADQVQETATKVISNAEKERTAEVKPHYDAAKAGDKEALQLMDDIEKGVKDINAGTKWKNDAVQQAGRWYQFTNQMGMQANELASKLKEWTGTKAEKQALADMEAEGGKPNPNVAKVENLLDRHKEGQAATQAAVDAAAERQGFLDKWQAEVNAKADKLAEKKLPEIQSKVGEFTSKIDEEIRLVGAKSDAGKILAKFKASIAPESSEPILPSQLEAAYKTARSTLDIGITSTAEQRAAAGVLKDHIKDLDALIKDVSPEIKQGRELYKAISDTYVDPLKKGPLGKLAGKGADAQKEASHTRMVQALQSDVADPATITKIADEFNKVDKTAFPNAVREHLEAKFDKAAKAAAGDPNARMTGSKFADAIAGTPKELDNLATMTQKVAEAQGMTPKQSLDAAKGMRTVVQVLRATGNVANLGLRGAEETSDLTKLGAAGGVLAGGGHANYGMVRAGLDKAADVVNAGAYKNLAKIFTDPNAVQKMVKLAGLKGEQKAARQAMVKDILTMTVGAELASPTEQADEKERNRVYVHGLPK